MRVTQLIVAFAVIVLGEGAYAKARPPKTCLAEIGAREARALVRDCLEADPATPAICRIETPCDGLRQMITEACRVRPSDKLVCRARRENDDDEEDDEDENE